MRLYKKDKMYAAIEEKLFISVEKPIIQTYYYSEWSNTMFNEYPEILTVPQVSKALGIGTRSAYTLIREKELGHIRIGRKILIPKVCLEDFIDSAKIQIRKSTCCYSTVIERKETL